MTIPDDMLVYIEHDPPPFLEPYYEQEERLDQPPGLEETQETYPFEEVEKPNEDQTNRLNRIMLSSAFKQIEIDRTKEWIDHPDTTEPNIRKAIAIALERLKDHDKAQASIEDRLDSLSRRVEYHTIKAKENIKTSKANIRKAKKCLKEKT